MAFRIVTDYDDAVLLADAGLMWWRIEAGGQWTRLRWESPQMYFHGYIYKQLLPLGHYAVYVEE